MVLVISVSAIVDFLSEKKCHGGKDGLKDL